MTDGERTDMVLNQCNSKNSDAEDDTGNTAGKVPIDTSWKYVKHLSILHLYPNKKSNQFMKLKGDCHDGIHSWSRCTEKKHLKNPSSRIMPPHSYRTCFLVPQLFLICLLTWKRIRQCTKHGILFSHKYSDMVMLPCYLMTLNTFFLFTILAAYVLVSLLFLWQIPMIINLWKEKVYFGSPF